MTNVVRLPQRPSSAPALSRDSGQKSRLVDTDIPARMERLLWSRFHTLVVGALGITWILDGLEVTLASSISGALKSEAGLSMSDTEVGLAGSAYLLGAVVGALVFGWARRPDRAQAADLHHHRASIWSPPRSRASPGMWRASSSSAFSRGRGIGGEYSAVNSTIQELVPGALPRFH